MGYEKELQRWSEVLEHLHSSYRHNIQYPRSMNIGKFGSGGALTSDTCNEARKMRRIIVQQVHEAKEALRKEKSDDKSVLDVYC